MNIEQLTQEAISYIADQLEINDTQAITLDIEELARIHVLQPDDICTLICNLEDQDTMQELIDGDLDTFDPWDESQFNDGYWDMIEDLGLSEDEDDV